MRKASREMDSQWALEVMRRAPYITVSFTRVDGSAYGVPLSLACTSDDVWYFHCAPEGDKLDAIAVHPEVCLSAVTKASLLWGRRTARLHFNIVRPSLLARRNG